uniref:NADH-ubiquinone oxidoreductase chain 5 n=1 Tax=Pinctada albina TaxID=315487 RepID=A0A1S5UZM8_9BIVA|nr:NADH dehydrogenase subunit 5 [Pinctada albina]
MKKLWSVYWVGIFLCCLSLVFLGLASMSSKGVSVLVEWGLGLSSFQVIFDFYSLIFLWVICLISGSVMVFSSQYMEGDTFVRRFHLSVLSFVVAMVCMVLASNLFSTMVGWDGLGVTSFYLVQYFQNQDSFDASFLTGLSNRVGDVFVVLALCQCLSFSGSSWLKWSSVILVLGGMTKSAQFPFSAWLPAAMSAPTPVSSLVHSSTLVTAGVYLLVRYGSEEVSEFLLMASLMTMNVAGLSAVFEDDLKKIVALSTLGHLSFMMLALGLGMCDLAMFHCVVHALGKAGMFICVGNLMLAQMGSQDSRSVNWWYSSLDISYWGLFLSSGILMGVPFFSAGVSKEMILHACLELGSSWVVPMLLASGVLSSFSYTMSLWWSLMSEKLCSPNKKSEEVVLPVVVLVGSLICSGFLLKNMFFGEVSEMYDSAWLSGGAFLVSVIFCLLSAYESPLYKKKFFFFQSLCGLESVSGQLPSKLMKELSEGALYLEGWSEALYPGKGLYSSFHCSDLGSKEKAPIFVVWGSGFMLVMLLLVSLM